jgi:hypothetical protein
MYALLLWLPLSADAGPDIDPGNLYLYMAAKRSTLTTSVRNQGDTTAFVQIQLAEITFDASGNAQERTLAEEDGFARALLATPPRLIIPAGGSHQARIIYRGSRATERYFRVRYVPVAPKAGDAFGLQAAEAKAHAEALQAGVGVLKAMGTLVIIGPEQPRYATRLEPGEERLRILNEGNATVQVEDARYCNLETEQCSLSSTLRIRPGKYADVDRRSGQAYRFIVREGSRQTPHVYPQTK